MVRRLAAAGFAAIAPRLRAAGVGAALVGRCEAAAAEEAEHAGLCRQLVGLYAGEEEAPAELAAIEVPWFGTDDERLEAALLIVGTCCINETLATAQDRLAEKTFFREIGIEPAPFARIDHPDQIEPELARLGGSGVLKSRFAGYDGKGQVRLHGKIQPYPAWSAIGTTQAILEAWIEHDREISVIAARGADGEAGAMTAGERTAAGAMAAG